MTQSEQVREIVAAIVRYIENHPRAIDSADGILRWWLPPEPGHTLESVEEALAVLIANGRVTRHVTPDGRKIYSDPDA